jgi:lipopolysaccharide export system protein LptA
MTRLERISEKWKPVFRKNARQNKEAGTGFDTVKSKLVFATVVALSAFAAAAAYAGGDAKAKFGLSDPNAPISISADRLDADDNTKTLVYSGNAVVHQGDVFLRTDKLRVVAPDGKTPDKIYADGHVVVTSPNGTATGDAGVYNVGPRIITLKGHVVLTRGDNVMRSETLAVNLISGVANLGGEAKGGRIHGLFTPKASDDAGK